MKFLEELKAAQEVIDKWQDIKKLFYYSENTSAPVITVLRRIPQLIDALEWAKETEEWINKRLEEPNINAKDINILLGRVLSIQTVLSKLEGKK